ncbi:MAG TPA: energy transducer TonB, partial [Edaphobacter sp.]|nr:energy transducer TonB [Edaphobacter sp.]
MATYLPLAKAAHIQGVVVMMAEFGTDGAVTRIRVLNGPEMLRTGAVDFVKSWRANPYTGPRTCPVVVTYTLGSSSQTSGKRIDPQHY